MQRSVRQTFYHISRQAGVSGILCVTAQRCDDHRPAGSMLPAGRRRLRFPSYTGTSVKRSAYRTANWFMACFQS
jgi:hypothetical protein